MSVGDYKLCVASVAGRNHRICLVQPKTHGLLAKDRLRTRIRGSNRLLGVGLRVRAYTDKIDPGIDLEQVLVER